MNVQVYDPSIPIWSRLTNVVSSPLNALEAAVWTLICVSEGSDFFSELHERIQQNGAQVKESQSALEATKKFIYTSYSFIGTCANVLSYVDRVGVISLSRFAPIVSVVGYVARVIVSGSNVWDTIEDFNAYAHTARTSEDAAERKKALQHQDLALFKLIANVSLVGWAILGVVTLVVASPLVTTLFHGFCLVGLTAAIVEAVYQSYIRKDRVVAKLNPSHADGSPPSPLTAKKVFQNTLNAVSEMGITSPRPHKKR